MTPRVVEARKSPTGTNRRLNVQEETDMNKTKQIVANVAGTAVFAIALVGLYTLTGRKWG